MYFPPESHNLTSMHPEHNYPLPGSKQDDLLARGFADWDGPAANNPRNFSLRQAPPPTRRGIAIRSRAFHPQKWLARPSYPSHPFSHPKWIKALRSSHPLPTQKWVTVLILLLIAGIILAIPLLSWRIFFSTQSRTVQPHSTAIISTVVPPTPTPAPTPLPMGTLIVPPVGKIMTGISMDGSVDAISTFEKSIGKDASILTFSQDWGATGGDQNFPASWASAVRAQGSLPMITWQPWVTETYPQGNNEPVYALKNIIAGNFDTYIRQWAQDAKAWRNPFFLRFAYEMNGNWTPWSELLNGNKAGEFVRAWQHVHDIFTAVGATNVTWVWNPNVNYSGDGGSIPLAEVYPGDRYVDWTAIDGFNWGLHANANEWQTFSQVYSSTYTAMLKITKKPIMLAQTGSNEKGGNKAAWISNAFTIALPSQFPAVRAVVWFNQSTQEDWRVNSSPAALNAFAQVMRSPRYAANIYGNYLGG